MFFYSKILSKFVLFIYYAMKSILEANSTNIFYLIKISISFHEKFSYKD